MLKKISFVLLGLVGALAFESAPLFAQTSAPAAQPESLSLGGLMGESSKPEPKPFKVEIPAAPKNATADELFAYVDGLQDALPQPSSQEEMFQLVDALSKAYLETANQILALKDLTPEQKERATQLKVVALTSRANVDADAAKELDAFVEETLKNAKTDEELIKAYQLKLQVLAAGEGDSLAQINALADEMFALEQEELQIFAIEVKAQAFLTGTQQTGAVDKAIFDFVDSVVEDAKRSKNVKEKALEMKLVALVIASELEKEKDAADQDATFGENAEKLFVELLDGDYSADLKKTVYQLRLQTLNPQADDAETVAKLNDVVARLLKEEDQELQALGNAVKGQQLLFAAQKDEAAVAELEKFADQLLEVAKTNENVKTQAVGLKIQALSLKKDAENLMKFVDAQLVDADAELKSSLTRIKLQLISQAVGEDAAALAQYEAYLDEASADEELAGAVDNVYASQIVGQLSKIAEDGGTIEQFNKVVDELKSRLEKRPSIVSALLIARQAIDQIGEKNGNVKLFDETFAKTIEFCKASKNEELSALGENLDSYLKRMQEMEAAEAAAPAEEK